MSRGRLAFKETDVARAIRGARRAGIEHPRVEILRDGRIIVEGGAAPVPLSSRTRPADGDDLDTELEAWRAEHGDG